MPAGESAHAGTLLAQTYEPMAPLPQLPPAEYLLLLVAHNWQPISKWLQLWEK